MGNECCSSDHPDSYNPDFEALPPCEFDLRCEICSKEIKHVDLQTHLDLNHFARLFQKEGEPMISCLLCEFMPITLAAHQQHMELKHRYMLGFTPPHSDSLSSLRTHASIKESIIQVTAYDVSSLGNGRFQIQGMIMSAVEFEKEYGAVEFDEEKAKGDLIWRHVFTQYPQITHYRIEHEPQIKTILSKATLYSPIS